LIVVDEGLRRLVDALIVETHRWGVLEGRDDLETARLKWADVVVARGILLERLEGGNDAQV